MTAIEKLVAKFEIDLAKYLGTYLVLNNINNATTSYAVWFPTVDQSGVILISVTNYDVLKISFLKGNHPLTAIEIYCSPDILNYNKAEQALNLLLSLHEVAVYKGFEVTIEQFASIFKSNFL